MLRIMVGILAVLVLTSTVSQACLVEAKLVAKVESTEKDGFLRCLARINPDEVSYFETNPACPLSLKEIVRQGIEVGIKDGHDCTVSSGDEVSGRLKKTTDGAIVFF